MRTTELEAIIEEEAEITEPTTPSEMRLVSALNRVSSKLLREHYVFTQDEKDAIKHALQDVGELYLFTGTSSGFDVESEADVIEHQNRGRLAREQAYQLGIRL